MRTFVHDLIHVLESCFPKELSLHRALYALLVVVSLYPLFLLHQNQQHESRIGWTGWISAMVLALDDGFHPQRENPEVWEKDGDPGPGTSVFAENMLEDVEVLWDVLGLAADPEREFLRNLQPVPLILHTLRLDCAICPPHNQPATLRRRESPKRVMVIDDNFRWHRATLYIAHCPKCKSDYYPDRYTFKAAGAAPRSRNR